MACPYWENSMLVHFKCSLIHHGVYLLEFQIYVYMSSFFNTMEVLPYALYQQPNRFRYAYISTHLITHDIIWLRIDNTRHKSLDVNSLDIQATPAYHVIYLMSRPPQGHFIPLHIALCIVWI